MMYDYLIIGQGLAGSHVAWQALQRGEQPLVVDRYLPGAASYAAGGLVNPVTGRNLVKTWQADALIPFAHETYRAQEGALGQQFYHLQDVIRLFRDEKQSRKWWNNRRHDAAYQPYVKAEALPAAVPEVADASLGGVVFQHGAFLNTADYLRAFRRFLAQYSLIRAEALPYHELSLKADRVQWGHLEARHLIFCEGWAVQENPFFRHIPLKPVKGQVARIYAPELALDSVLNKGVWLIPLGGGYFRAGATYEHDLTSFEPSESGFEQLSQQLDNLLKVPYQVTERHVGIRPATRDSQPAVGWHPDYPNVGLLNGLGSKGVLQAPYLAQKLLGSSTSDSTILPEVNVQRFV